MSRVVAVLLAAGAARRYGRLKQLETLDGMSLVRRAAQSALDAGLEVRVVTGAESAAVEAELADLAVVIVRNPQWSRGLGRSIACGVAALLRQPALPDAVLIQLADQVLVSAADLRRIVAHHRQQPDRIIVADHGGGTFGPPCLFPHDCFFALSQLDGDRGARSVIEQHPSRLLPLALPAAAFDVDTPADLARLRARPAV